MTTSELNLIEKLTDMHESMLETLENATKVHTEQQLLLQIIEASDQSEHFEKFISDVTKEASLISEKLEHLSERINTLAELISLATDNDDVKEVLTKFAFVLNLFGA